MTRAFSTCTRIAFALSTLVALGCGPVAGPSPDGVWEGVDPSSVEIVEPASLPSIFSLTSLDPAALEDILDAAPHEGRDSFPPVPLSLPTPDGDYLLVNLVFSPISAHGLTLLLDGVPTAAPPLARTFSFEGNGGVSGRMSVGGDGRVRVLMQTSAGLQRIDPFETRDGTTLYGSYLNRDRTDDADLFEHVIGEQIDPNRPPSVPAGALDGLESAVASRLSGLDAATFAEVTGTELRTYSLVMAATGEYFQGRSNAFDPLPVQLQDVVDSITAEVNAVNAILGPEVAVRLSFDWVLIWTDPNTDPYDETANPNAPACALRDQNVAVDPIIGAANYDIGFVLSTGSGNGCAWYVLCLADKYRGATRVNLANPIGGSTGVMLHEMGHQLGARHSFSGSGCAAIEFNAQAAYGPGSGTTIMSYLGSCGSDNVDTSAPSPSAGQYYHGISFDEIAANTQSLACGVVSNTGNDPPTVDAGPDYTIPQDTPFMLAGSGNDPNADPLTFNWEQFDQAPNARPVDSDTLMDGPIFRSVPPASSPTRTLPLMANVLSGSQQVGEILPTVDRSMTFRLTARDNRVGGGGVASDEMSIDVDGPPFFITEPNGSELYFEGCPAPIEWVVGGGDVAAQVDLSYSTDEGQSFTPLATLANDGSDEVLLPCGTTSDGRMMLKGSDSIFFDVSDGDFFVTSSDPTVSVSAQGGSVDDSCQFTVEFSAEVEDMCSVLAADVDVEVVNLTGNFTLGAPTIQKNQVDGQTVSVTGSVLVSDLQSSPATVGVGVIAENGCGEKGSDAMEADVVDDTPPTISVELSPDVLWPPNHKMIPITAEVVAEDNCPGVSFVLSSATSDEPDDDIGDGAFPDDIQGADLGTADLDLLLRAERQGPKDGRVYTVIYTATDGSNNEAMDADQVTVPHDQH